MKASRLGLREVTVHFGAFDYTMTCLVGPPDNIEKYVRWKFDDHAPDRSWRVSGSRGMYFCHRGHAPIVWIPRRRRTPREYGTLAHEVMHVVRMMLVDWAGMPLTIDTDEAFCHALGYAVTAILEALDRR